MARRVLRTLGLSASSIVQVAPVRLRPIWIANGTPSLNRGWLHLIRSSMNSDSKP